MLAFLMVLMSAFLMVFPCVLASNTPLLRSDAVMNILEGQYPNCVGDTPYKDLKLGGGTCVAFCTGDEVPQTDTSGGSVKVCTSCPPPGADNADKLYADHEVHECVRECPPGKAPNEKMSCAVCKQPLPYADHVNHKCVAKCPPGKVPDSLQGNDCKECGDEFPYADHVRHACVKQCAAGQVGSLSLKECRTCEAGKFANHKTHDCEDDCPADHPYKDGLDCVMTCSAGKVPNPKGDGNASVCALCPSGKYADHAKHACVTSCSSGYTPDPDGTLAPMYRNDCQRCPAGKFADHKAHECVVNCPDGSTQNDEKRNCDGTDPFAPCPPPQIVYVPVPPPTTPTETR